MVKFRPEIEPVVRLIEETPRDRALEVGDRAAQEGPLVQRPARRPVPGGHPQHQAAAGRLQVPRRDGHQLGARAGPIVGRERAAAPAALGPRQLQELAGAGRQGRRLGARARRRIAPAQAAAGQGRIRPGDGDVGRRGGRRGRRRPLPQRRAPPRPWSRSGAWPCAISAISATRRSSPPRAGAPCRRSAGSTPSPCCARSSSACSTSRATPPTARRARTRPTWKTPARSAQTGRSAATTRRATQALLQVIRQATPGSRLGRGRQAAQSGDRPRLALGRRDPRRVRAHDAQPGNRRHSRHDGHQLAPLHLHGQRRRHDPPAGPAPGRRLAAHVSRPRQADRRGRDRRAQSESRRPISSGDEAVGEIFATINEDRKKAAAQGHGLPGPRGLARSRSSTPPGE